VVQLGPLHFRVCLVPWVLVHIVWWGWAVSVLQCPVILEVHGATHHLHLHLQQHSCSWDLYYSYSTYASKYWTGSFQIEWWFYFLSEIYEQNNAPQSGSQCELHTITCRFHKLKCIHTKANDLGCCPPLPFFPPTCPQSLASKRLGWKCRWVMKKNIGNMTMLWGHCESKYVPSTQTCSF
jgi:hypothetical protein